MISSRLLRMEVKNMSEEALLETLAKIEVLLREGSPEALEAARTISKVLLVRTQHADPRQRVAALTALGHGERFSGMLAESDRTYGEALMLLPSKPADPEARFQYANLLTCQGLSLLLMSDLESLKKAKACFEQSIALRDRPDTNEAETWGLSAGWLNLADTLAALGGQDALEEAVRCTEKARETLARLSDPQPAACQNRLALSWMKTAEYSARLSAEYARPMEEKVMIGFANAAEILQSESLAGEEESRRMLAAALSNLSRSRLLLEKRGSRKGEEEAREAIHLLGDAVFSAPETLFLALSARMNIACHLAGMSNGEDGDDDVLLEVTDVIEEAMTIAAEGRRKWGANAVADDLLGELTRLGAEAYRVASPDFLVDFLMDVLDPERGDDHFADSPAVHEAAVRVLWHGISDLQKAGFAGFGSDEYDKRRDHLAAWQLCREELAAIRTRYFIVESA